MISIEDLSICSRSLMPCPNCGNECGEVKTVRDKYWAQCKCCGYVSFRTFDVPWEAVDDWNKLSRSQPGR